MHLKLFLSLFAGASCTLSQVQVNTVLSLHVTATWRGLVSRASVFIVAALLKYPKALATHSSFAMKSSPQKAAYELYVPCMFAPRKVLLVECEAE